MFLDDDDEDLLNSLKTVAQVSMKQMGAH